MKQFSMDELRDLAPAYVMDTLSAEEREAFEAAMASSADLATDVADFRVVVERLATEQALAPSASVRARFLDRIAAEKTAPAAAPLTTASRAGSTATARAASRWWTTGILATALAASLLFAVRRNTDLETVRAQLAAIDAKYKADSAQLLARHDQLETVLEAETDLKVIHLATQTPGGAGIQFFWNLKQGKGLLHAFRLPPAARGRAYQMWFIRDGKPVPVKVFNSDPDGHGLVYGIDVPKDLKGVTLMAVTLEPEGGSLQPTSTPFMTGAVSTQ